MQNDNPENTLKPAFRICYLWCLLLLITTAIHASGIFGQRFLKTDIFQRAITHFQRGLALSQQEIWEDALTAFDDATKVRAEMADAYFQMGKIYHEQFQSSKSTKLFTLYIKYLSYAEDPEYGLNYIQTSNLLTEEEIKQAFQYWTELQNSAEYFFNRAELQYYLNKKNEALDSYRKSLKIDPDFKTSLLKIGDVLYETELYDKAEQALNKIINMEEISAKSLNYYGDCLQRKGAISEAISYLEKAAQKDKSQPSYRLMAAMAYTHLKRYGLASEMLQQLISDFPNYPLSYFYLGTIYQDFYKNNEKAKAYLQQFLEIYKNKNDTWTQKAQSRLETLVKTHD